MFWFPIAQLMFWINQVSSNLSTRFLLSRLLYRSTLKLQLCYETDFVMLFFYSSVTYKPKTYKSDRNKRIFSHRIMDPISNAFLTFSLLWLYNNNLMTWTPSLYIADFYSSYSNENKSRIRLKTLPINQSVIFRVNTAHFRLYLWNSFSAPFSNSYSIIMRLGIWYLYITL